MSFDSGDFGFFAGDLTVFVRVSLSENEFDSFVSVEILQNGAIKSLFAFGSAFGVDLLFEFNSLGMSFDSGDFGFFARNLIVFIRVRLSENEIDSFVSVEVLQNMISNFSKFGAGFLAIAFSSASFLSASFLAASLLGTNFLAASLLGADFLYTSFLAAGLFAVELLAGFASEFLAAGFLAVELLAGFSSEFLAAGFLAVELRGFSAFAIFAEAFSTLGAIALRREGFLARERLAKMFWRERFLAVKLRREGFLAGERLAKMFRRERFLAIKLAAGFLSTGFLASELRSFAAFAIFAEAFSTLHATTLRRERLLAVKLRREGFAGEWLASELRRERFLAVKFRREGFRSRSGFLQFRSLFLGFDNGSLCFFARNLTVFVCISLSEDEIYSFVGVKLGRERSLRRQGLLAISLRREGFLSIELRREGLPAISLRRQGFLAIKLRREGFLTRSFRRERLLTVKLRREGFLTVFGSGSFTSFKLLFHFSFESVVFCLGEFAIFVCVDAIKQTCQELGVLGQFIFRYNAVFIGVELQDGEIAVVAMCRSFRSCRCGFVGKAQ